MIRNVTSITPVGACRAGDILLQLNGLVWNGLGAILIIF